MGNQLVGIAPSQIFPVEHYLTEHSDLQFDINLGSTRFLKVARAKSQEGLVVVKVFAIHDPSLPLSAHKERAQQITNLLAVNSSVNCLPFQKALLSDKAGFLIREYVKFSLYDRISTRPFLAPIEKKWIAFQLLYALHQCHKSGVCHGDIKMENVTVTSWHWVLLTDFASFKPTHLPEDNPADFSYFFDTSRRRTCYIAPERFVKTLGSDSNQLLLPEVNVKEANLVPSMDIFSAGCVLAELFSDGHPPFDFSQLLAYRNGEYSLDKYMKKIEDPLVKALIEDMIQKEPNERVSAEIYLDRERGKLFPGYFYSFLHSYMLIFSASSPILSPDEKIERLRKDINNIISLLKTEEETYYISREKKNNNGCEALLLVTSLVTSCIRGLHFTNSKLQCLEILLELSAHSSSETILDRILPFIMHLIHDPFARVRVSAIHTLNKVLKLVKTVPPSDANVFPEYILPGLAAVTHDEAVIVRTAFAENVADLAETALRLLEYWQVNPLESPRRSYESELATLHEMMQQMVASLLTDSHNTVKQTLIENGISKLCVFFGKQKSNDVLLSHMITFLNDKEDKQLRGSFFDCIVGVAAFVGIHCSPILSPLLHQGLTDPEEFVARKAINAITALTELSLLHKYALYHLLEESVCLLAHPNLWIRQAVVGFVSALARTLNVVDVQCKVMSVIEPYLKTPVIQLEKEVLLLNSLKPCIPRVVYDTVAKCSELQLVLQSLIDRHKARNIQHTHVTLPTALPGSPYQNHTVRNLFGRLISDGMTEDVEDQLILMSNHLHKVCRHYNDSKPSNPGKVILDLKQNIQCYTVTLSKTELPKPDTSAVMRRGGDDIMSGSGGDEWKVDSSGGTIQSSGPKQEKSPSHNVWDNNHSLDIDYSTPEKSFIQYRCAPCRLELRELVRHRESLHRSLVLGREWNHKYPHQAPPGWRIRPALVSHLHGHSAPVNRLVSLPSSSLLASCSNDGCIRIWDCGKMEGRNIANRARQVYNCGDGALVGMTLCNNNSSLAVASHSGQIILLRIDSNTNKIVVRETRQLDLNEEGSPVDIAHFDSGSQSVLVYSTIYGCIIGWDLRSPGIAWKLDNDLKLGVVTAMLMDSRQCCLSLGTSSGYHTSWDLRFHLPIAKMAHPNGARVRCLASHPTQPSWLISSVQGNNEVSLWGIESGTRQVVLWGSNAPPLSNSQMYSHSVCAMYSGLVDNNPFLLTGGTDHRIRYWNLSDLSSSYMVIPGGSDVPGQINFSYKSRLIDGTDVVQEIQTKCRQREKSSVDESPRAGPDQPATGHHNAITDMTLCHSTQCFMVTSDRDGVIKVWK